MEKVGGIILAKIGRHCAALAKSSMSLVELRRVKNLFRAHTVDMCTNGTSEFIHVSSREGEGKLDDLFEVGHALHIRYEMELL